MTIRSRPALAANKQFAGANRRRHASARLHTPTPPSLMGSKHTLTVPGRYEKVRAVCAFIAAGATAAGLDETAVFHIELACDEACTNIIEHAYGAENEGDIVASYQVTGNQFTITLHDNGRIFDPTDVPQPPLTQTDEAPPAEELKVGGLGIHFMRQLMDKIEFHFDEKKGNTLVMVKNISGNKA